MAGRNSSTPRKRLVSPLAREPELEPRPGPRSPMAQEQAWARCDRPGFEGGVSFWDFYGATRPEHLIEPGERRIHSEPRNPLTGAKTGASELKPLQTG
jgi:hypothetical protein